MNSRQTSAFLELGRQGRSSWWHYLIGFIIIAISYIVGNVVAFFNILWWSPTPMKVDVKTGSMAGVDPFLIFISANLVLVCMLIAVWLVIRFIHGRPLMSLVTPQQRVNFARIGWTAVAWATLMAIAGAIAYFVFPNSIAYSLHLEEFLRFLPAVVLLTPIQCFAEELVFRGYLLQGMAPLIKNTWVLAVINAIGFACMHIGAVQHTDQTLVVASFAVIGLWLALCTLRTNSIECSLGMHIGNNMFGFLVLGYEQYQFTTSSIFVWKHTQPLFELISALVCGLIVYLVIRKRIAAA